MWKMGQAREIYILKIFSLKCPKRARRPKIQMKLSTESIVHLKRFTQNQARKKVEETEKDNMREKVTKYRVV